MNVDSPTLNILSLFSGGGGLDIGLERALERLGYASQHVAYVEREAYAAGVLVARMEEARLAPAPVWTDIAKFDGRPFRGLVDIIVGGWPCQPWSVAGSRAGVDDERDMWPHVARLLGEIQPRWLVGENVSGFIRGGLGRTLRDLVALGFDAEWTSIRASDVGAPHRRERMFILADSQRAKWHDADGCGQDVGYPDGARPQGRRRDAREYAGELPPWPPGPGDHAAWSSVLERWPELAPAMAVPEGGSARPTRREREASGTTEGKTPEPGVRRVVDGMADRVDRLRILGNGVAPAQAERAILELWQRAES